MSDNGEVITFGQPDYDRAAPPEPAPEGKRLMPADDTDEHNIVTTVLEGGMGRHRALVALRSRGASYTQIAEWLGYNSAADVRNDLTAAIADVCGPDDAKTLRAIQSNRLDRLLAAVWPSALDDSGPDHIAYNRRASEIIAELSKLHGVNAPAVMQLTTPDSEKIDEVVNHILEIQNGGQPAEGDIFELVQSEDGTYQEDDSA